MTQEVNVMKILQDSFRLHNFHPCVYSFTIFSNHTDKSTNPFDFGDIYGTPLDLTSKLRNYYDLLTESCDLPGTCHQLLFSPSPFSHKKHGMSALVRLLLRKVDRCWETRSVEINSHKLFLFLLNKMGGNIVMDECR